MTGSTFSAPLEDRYFEDYIPGSVGEFGYITVKEEEIIAFGKSYDPQVYHTDPERAKESVYKGLIASGWQTGAFMMRLAVDHYLSHVASLGSPGVDKLRWLKPVRPGDKLSIRVTVVETKRSRSKPDRGLIRAYIEVINQNREVVMTLEALNFLLCRETTGEKQPGPPEESV
jgi:acyl dehydratase